MVYPTPTARKGETFMLFGYPTGVQGNVINGDGVNELVSRTISRPGRTSGGFPMRRKG
jgi:hypothetical protein